MAPRATLRPMMAVAIALVAALSIAPAMTVARTQMSSLLEPGISLELARWRARHYRDIRYRIDALVSSDIDILRGTIEIEFTLDRRVALILDWRPGPRSDARVEAVNGLAARGVRLENDHIIIPAEHLRAGVNRLRIDFSSPIAVSGSGLTRYRDREDTSDYVYSLLVPADASTVFPCFDQPDLKGRFTLALDVPAAWQVVANAPVASEQFTSGDQRKVVRFLESEPISTYLFAFAAGPFDILTGTDGDTTRLFVRRSRSARARAEAQEVLRLNRAAIRYFESYFDHRFPFAKYDLVLIPEFPYNGMEHAGATFLREDAVLFPSVPGAADHLRRANLIFHETSHQWFGNLVTMRWFDDLWLKEGFANLMAAKAAAAIVPELNPWIAFLALKTNAYRTDATQGTTPIWQAIPNLSAAKSAYGSIVYSKGPAILRQAEFAIGEDVFRHAVRAFVRRHAYGAASWRDLVGVLENSSGRDFTRWAGAWIKRRGMAKITVDWAGDPVTGLGDVVIRQTNTLGDTGLWPQRIRVLLGDDGSGDRVVDVALSGPRTRVPTLRGTRMPSYVLMNDQDVGYGLFMLDARSRAYLSEALPRMRDPLRRALVWNAMWDSVREGEYAPGDFVALAIAGLTHETDEITLTALLARMQIAVRWYLSEAGQMLLAPTVDQALIARISTAKTPGLRITYFRALAAVAASKDGLIFLKELVQNQRHFQDMPLSIRDHHRIIQRLATVDMPASETLIQAVNAQSDNDEGRRYRYALASARSDQKRMQFDAFLGDPTLPEAWIEEALGPFNAPEHAERTSPYLAKALEALPRLKRERKIFFVNRWLDAFIGGQRSAEALAEVHRFLDAHPTLDIDLRRKVLEATGELERTVSIRRRHLQ
ncbi:MAG: M1 family aminopeptidase [Burkholderiales bacterium]